MKKLMLATILFAAVVILGVRPGVAGEGERKIQLKDVPKNVLEAVKKKVKDFKITEIEVETERGLLVYEFEGTAGGKKLEVEVTVDKKGAVKKVEVEEDDDDDDHHHEKDKD